jgi:hypothetical protein
MVTAGSLIVDPDAPGYDHCVSCYVRRAIRAGVDASIGRDRSHCKV